MSQTPLLGTRATPAIPITGSSIGSDSTITLIPGDPANVDAALAALYALIAALGTPVITGFLTDHGGEHPQTATIAASGSALTLDLSLYNAFQITLTANCTITLTNPPANGTHGHWDFAIHQGGSGSYTITWPASVKWRASDGTNTGTAPALSTAVGAQDDFELSTGDGGTTYGATPASSGTGFTAGGDLTGTSTSQTVAKINGSALGTTSGAAVGDRLRWDGSGWTKSSLIWRPVTVYDGTNWLPLVDGSGNAIMAEA